MESEMTIKLIELVQTDQPQGRVTEGGVIGGDKVRETIEENWDKYEKINISFDRIIKMTRTFTDEAFAKVLDKHTLEEFNQKLFFPDAREAIVQDLNAAIKLRLKILAAQREREKDELSL